MPPDFDQLLANEPPILDQAVPSNQLGTVQLGRAHDQRCVTRSWRGQRLAALADGRIVAGANLTDWEGFLPISAAELDMLRQIVANHWIIRSSGALIRAADVSLEN